VSWAPPPATAVCLPDRQTLTAVIRRADDDPRLAQQSRVSSQPGPSTGPPTAAAAAAGWLAGFSSGFDWDAPPFKLVPRPDAPVSIPDVEVFGLPVPGPGLLAVVAVGVFFGFRACLAAAALGELFFAHGLCRSPSVGLCELQLQQTTAALLLHQAGSWSQTVDSNDDTHPLPEATNPSDCAHLCCCGSRVRLPAHICGDWHRSSSSDRTKSRAPD
jgi:hypothetical protein